MSGAFVLVWWLCSAQNAALSTKVDKLTQDLREIRTISSSLSDKVKLSSELSDTQLCGALSMPCSKCGHTEGKADDAGDADAEGGDGVDEDDDESEYSGHSPFARGPALAPVARTVALPAPVELDNKLLQVQLASLEGLEPELSRLRGELAAVKAELAEAHAVIVTRDAELAAAGTNAAVVLRLQAELAEAKAAHAAASGAYDALKAQFDLEVRLADVKHRDELSTKSDEIEALTQVR